jgi:hypothetical protein
VEVCEIHKMECIRISNKYNLEMLVRARHACDSTISEQFTVYSTYSAPFTVRVVPGKS